MRALVLIVLAACEFQPPPKQQPPTAQSPSPKVAEVAPAGSGAGSGGSGAAAPNAGSGAGSGIVTTPACTTTAEKVADVLIASAKDPSLRASYEQAKERIVRATAEACTTQGWTEQAQACFVASKDEADLRACEKKFPPPNAPRPRPAPAAPPTDAAKKADSGAVTPPTNVRELQPKPR